MTSLTENALENIERAHTGGGRRGRDVTVDEVFALAIALEVSPLVLLLPQGGLWPYQVLPDQTVTSRAVHEWLVGERRSPLSAEVSEAERASARQEFQRLLATTVTDEPDAKLVEVLGPLVDRILREKGLIDGPDEPPK